MSFDILTPGFTASPKLFFNFSFFPKETSDTHKINNNITFFIFPPHLNDLFFIKIHYV